MDKKEIKQRRGARKVALQGLYQWVISGNSLHDIEAQIDSLEVAPEKIDKEYFCRLLHGVPENLVKLDELISPFLDRTLGTLTPVELIILRMGAFELFLVPEIPYRVVLDEAVILARAFGAQDGYRYVNGVLNNLAKTIRVTEI